MNKDLSKQTLYLPGGMNSEKIILHLCATEGSDSLPYKQAGYDVRLVGEDIGIENYHPPENVYGIIANPPCTMFSAARTTGLIPTDLREGMRLVKECLRIIWESQYTMERMAQKVPPLKFWMLENPASGRLRWFLGHPVFEYCQSEYGAIMRKKTGLWGMFNRPKRPLLFTQLPPNRSIGKNYWKGRPSGMQARSSCPIDFAMAFFEANP